MPGSRGALEPEGTEDRGPESLAPGAPSPRLLCSVQFSSVRPGAACLALLSLPLWVTLTLAASPSCSSSRGRA